MREMSETSEAGQSPSLVIMAAVCRFGGLKQITPVGLSGEMIIDYSIYDALAAAFGSFLSSRKRGRPLRSISATGSPGTPTWVCLSGLSSLPAGYARRPTE